MVICETGIYIGVFIFWICTFGGQLGAHQTSDLADDVDCFTMRWLIAVFGSPLDTFLLSLLTAVCSLGKFSSSILNNTYPQSDAS